MASAVLLLSPVIIITSLFILCSLLTASLENSFNVSATAIKPTGLLFNARIITVFPSFSKSLNFPSTSSILILYFLIKLLFPKSIVFLLYLARIPYPGIALKEVASGIFNLLALLIIASASGCSEPFSAIAAYFKISFLFTLFNSTMSVNSGFPLVKVPVLSKTIAFIL